jgi:peptidoglycan hydrolase-like protein with peptidoglycan-binding domain
MRIKKSVLFFILFIFCFFCGCKKKNPEVSFESPYEIITELEDLKKISPQLKEADKPLTPQVTKVPDKGADNKAVALSAYSPDYTPSIKDIQLALKNSGFYKGALDGKFGPRTKVAIKDFQRENNLKVDGVAGKKTWQILSRYFEPNSVKN